MDRSALSELHLRLYVDILQSLALEDPSQMEIVDEMTLGYLVADLPHSKDGDDEPLAASGTTDSQAPETLLQANESRPRGIFSEEELLMFGASTRRHLDISLQGRILDEIRQVLRSVAAFYGGTETTPEDGGSVVNGLPDRIQELKREIEAKNPMVATASQRIAELIAQITKMHEDLDQKLKHAVFVTLPVHETTRRTSIELLAATIETSLVKLSLARARADRALYNHTLGQGASKDPEGPNVAKALEAAYMSLKKDEKEMNAQSQSLDRQLQEYESLMQLVDGGKSGYRQVISDWTKVKQETDECLKDLRRLGWTGD